MLKKFNIRLEIYILLAFISFQINAENLGLAISTSDNLAFEKTIIFNQGALTKNFDYYSQLTSTCVLPIVQQDNITITARSFYLSNQNAEESLEIKLAIDYDSSSLKIKKYENDQILNETINANSNFRLDFDYDCNVNPNFNDSETVIWSLITMDLTIENSKNESKVIQLSYIKVCQTSKSNLFAFDASFGILAILSMVICFFGAKNQRITSFQRKSLGVSITWWMGFIYIILIFLFMIVWAYAQSITQIGLFVIMIIVSFLAVTFTLKELLYYFKIFEICNFKIKIPKFNISVLGIICSLLSVGLLLVWILTDHYILTNVIALFIVFACFKIFKINSLKNGAIFLLIVGIYEIFEDLFVDLMNLPVPIDNFFNSDFCYPLKLEIPTFNLFLTKRCSWLSITNLLFPGLFLSYFHRYDASKKIKIYFLMGFFGYFCGNAIWILVSFFAAYAHPLLLYTLPFMVGLCSLLAYKRNENLELWEGLFYDHDLAFANIKKNEGSQKMFEEKTDVFNKETLFDGLLDSSFDSSGSIEKGENEKEMILFNKQEEKKGESPIKSKIKAFEEMKMIPGMSITNRQELENIIKHKGK